MSTLTIGEIAKETGISVETLRFYEHKGLIAPPGRRSSGYRQYGENDVTRVRFIKTAKALGFSLLEIHDLLNLRIAPGTNAGDVKKRALLKIADITEKIKNLQSIKRTLVRITEQCCGTGPLDECPILKALGGGKGCGVKARQARKK